MTRPNPARASSVDRVASPKRNPGDRHLSSIGSRKEPDKEY